MSAQSTIKPVGIVSALAKALPELEGAKKNKLNPAFKSKYADLAAVIDAIDPIRAHGLWYRQVLHDTSEGASVETFYIHESGEELSAGSLFMPATKKDAQGFGSALSYCRRYSLQAAFGLATEDDDGNAASQRQPAKFEPPADYERLSEAQQTELIAMLSANNVPVGGFLEAAGDYRDLRDVPADMFAKGKAWINKQAKAKQPSLAEDLADEISY